MTKSKKKKLLTVGIFDMILCIILIFLVGLMGAVLVSLFGIMFLLLNLWAKKKIAWNADHLFSDIDRNYDYLLIGEPWNYNKLNGKVLCFFCPNRTLLSSYEMTRRLFSLLKENTGTLMISCREKCLDSRKLSVLDVPYLHETQRYKYGIRKAKLKIYLPFVFAPFSTIRYILMNKRECMTQIEVSKYPQLAEFCAQRNINCQIVKTK